GGADDLWMRRPWGRCVTELGECLPTTIPACAGRVRAGRGVDVLRSYVRWRGGGRAGVPSVRARPTRLDPSGRIGFATPRAVPVHRACAEGQLGGHAHRPPLAIAWGRGVCRGPRRGGSHRHHDG